MILVKGMFVAMRSVFFTLVLLGVIIYLFSIMFRQLTDGTPVGQEYFSSVPASMGSLLMRGTLPDHADFVGEVTAEHPIFGILLCFFILFASLTVMNMLVGVLCEVVSVVSSVEKEQVMVTFVQNQLQTLLQRCVGDKPMSKAEFRELLGHPQAARALHEVGVDVLGLMEISDFIFKDGQLLPFPAFMEMVLELRGTNAATVKHIVDLQRFFHVELQRQSRSIQSLVCRMNGEDPLETYDDNINDNEEKAGEPASPMIVGTGGTGAALKAGKSSRSLKTGKTMRRSNERVQTNW